MDKILIINGSNVNLEFDNDALNEELKVFAQQQNIEIDFFQSNLEGELIDMMQEGGSGKYKAIILNAGSYGVSSLGLKDVAFFNEMKRGVPTIYVTIENNLKNIDKRHNLVGEGCFANINGFGPFSYHLAIVSITNMRTNTPVENKTEEQNSTTEK